jgi:hypothetical protein
MNLFWICFQISAKTFQFTFRYDLEASLRDDREIGIEIFNSWWKKCYFRTKEISPNYLPSKKMPILDIKFVDVREAPWSWGERRGLTDWTMVLGREFDSQVNLKARWIRRTTWWQKNKNNKDSQKGQVTPKKNIF